MIQDSDQISTVSGNFSLSSYFEYALIFSHGRIHVGSFVKAQQIKKGWHAVFALKSIHLPY